MIRAPTATGALCRICAAALAWGVRWVRVAEEKR